MNATRLVVSRVATVNLCGREESNRTIFTDSKWFQIFGFVDRCFLMWFFSP